MTTLDAVRSKYPDAETFKFGSTRSMCEALTGLVRDGKKTATCEAVAVFESGAEAWPKVGRKDIALDWDGNPAVVIQTMDLDIRKFIDVSEEFALLEGENDSLDGWRRDHQRYFENTSGFSPDMNIVCERFKVIELC